MATTPSAPAFNASSAPLAGSLLDVRNSGGKGGIRFDPANYSAAEIERIAHRCASEIAPLIGPERDLPAPDLGTDERVIDDGCILD